MRLICHVRGEGDILEAFLAHYVALGVSSFHFVVHGPREENARLHDLRHHYPIHVEQTYDTPFTSDEKQARLNHLVRAFRNQWLFVVDADEFVELPADLKETTRWMRDWNDLALACPLLQRIDREGRLPKADVVANPATTFPLCSVQLYRHMGVDASIRKYPLFWSFEWSETRDGGNHAHPLDWAEPKTKLLGVSHHYKWRACTVERLRGRVAGVDHAWKHESAGFLAYLSAHGDRLPTQDAFPYARARLFENGLLRRHVEPHWAVKAGLQTRWKARHKLRAAGAALAKRVRKAVGP